MIECDLIGGRHDSDRAQEGGCFTQPPVTLFVDRIPDFSGYFKICGLFGHIGSLLNVFVQQQRRFGRAFRFGFVRYSSLEVVSRKISLFNGVLVGGSVLSVALARFPRLVASGRVEEGSPPPSPRPVIRVLEVCRDEGPSADEEKMLSSVVYSSCFATGSGREGRGAPISVSSAGGCVGGYSFPSSQVCDSAGVLVEGAEEAPVTEHRSRGRPRKVVLLASRQF